LVTAGSIPYANSNPLDIKTPILVDHSATHVRGFLSKAGILIYIFHPIATYTNHNLSDAITKTKANIHFTFVLEAIDAPQRAPKKPPTKDAANQ